MKKIISWNFSLLDQKGGYRLAFAVSSVTFCYI